MTRKTQISSVMITALQRMIGGDGRVWILKGGYWVFQNYEVDSLGSPIGTESVGSQTVYALESRGLIERAKEFPEYWRDTRKITEKGRRIVALGDRLIAASLSPREYETLRNTVRELRLSGAALDPEQEENVKKFESTVAAYEEQHRDQGANG